MIKTIAENWEGKIEIDGQEYGSDTLFVGNNTFDIATHIKLYPAQKKAVKTENTMSKKEASGEVVITVKPYMTKKATPEFDFMAKWNNDNPMPLRTMMGRKIKETPGMVYMELHGFAEETITCLRCGKKLTNPISMKYGIGPECIHHVPTIADIDINDIESIKKKLIEVTWEGWIIKSAITSIVEQED